MTKRTPERDEDGMLAAEFALGLLHGEERTVFAKRMANDAALAGLVRQWEEHFVAFTDDIASVAPPQRVAAALERKLFVSAAQSQRLSIWNSLGFWRGLAVASLATVIGLGAWNLRPAPDAPGTALVAQVASTDSALKLVAYYDEGNGQLRLNRVDGAAAAGRSLELWLIAGQDAPVSLGVLPANSTTTVELPAALRSKLKGGVLAISDEPQGGSPTGAPTGMVLATGQLTSI